MVSCTVVVQGVVFVHSNIVFMHNIHIVHLPDMVVNVLLNVTVSQNLQMVNADTTGLQ